MRSMLINLIAALATVAAISPVFAQGDGIVRVRSAYSMTETIARIKQDVAAKGIMFFSEVDQSALAAAAGIKLRPSTLLTFGNPPLGTLFITAKAEAGLDWPVRLLVTQDDQGVVWAVYTDFKWIAARHGIRDRDEQFATATKVIASITGSVTGQ
jgi:uncharacterized protein (DUF302 family)